ncbi:MAG: Uma2 family endonuclease [Thiomicrorhabdus sp.]|nr:Uma2 family endonuclease [Thiomicrorhabdus sp.]
MSPTSAKRDEGLKFELYQQEGVKTYILAYPEEKVAKVYRLDEGRYIKEADYSNERFDFKIRECDLSIDFSQIWRN